MTDLADRSRTADVEQPVTPARALLRPRLRLRDHPGHAAFVSARPDVDAAVRGDARSSPRCGGRGSPTCGWPTPRRSDEGTVRVVLLSPHGRDAGRLAGGPARLRRGRAGLRRSPTSSCARCTSRVRAASRGDPQLRHVVVRLATHVAPGGGAARRGRRRGRPRRAPRAGSRRWRSTTSASSVRGVDGWRV